MRIQPTLAGSLFVIGLCSLAHTLRAQDASQSGGWTARVFGVRVIDDAFPKDAYEFPPFMGEAGTQLLLLVASPESTIIDIKADQCTITSLSGDQSGDLLKPREQPAEQQGFGFSFGQGPISPFAKVSQDRRQVAVEINAPRSPSANDTKVAIDGELVVVVAKGRKPVRLENVALARGRLKMDTYQVAISKVGVEDSFGERQFTVDIALKDAAADDLAETHFFDETGEEIEVQGTMTMGGPKYTTISYPLARQVERATIEFTFWEGREEVRVPIKAEQGLGF